MEEENIELENFANIIDLDEEYKKEFDEISEEFNNSSIYLDNLNGKDLDSLPLSLKEHISSTKSGKIMQYLQRYFTDKFLFNMIYVVRVLFAATLCSILVFIDRIAKNIQNPNLCVVVAVLLIKQNIGASLNNIFVFFGSMAGVFLALALSSILTPNAVLVGFIMFAITFISAMGKIDLYTVKFFLLFFSVILMSFTHSFQIGSNFHAVTFSYKLALSGIIGFVVLFIASFVFPVAATKRYSKKKKVIYKSVNLLLRFMVAYFSNPSIRACAKKNHQIKALLHIIETNISDCRDLLGNIQMENPWTSMNSRRNFLNNMNDIFEIEKAMASTLEHFSDNNPVHTLRVGVSPVASSLANELASFMEDLYKSKEMEDNQYLLTSIKHLKKTFNRERKKFVERVYGTTFFQNKELTLKIQSKTPRNTKEFEEAEKRWSVNTNLFFNEKDKKKDLKKNYFSELSATYFFVLNLIEIAKSVQKLDYQRSPKSCSNFVQGLKEIPFIWSLSAPGKLEWINRDYLKSKEFKNRISTAFLFSLIVLTASITIMWDKFSNKFYNNFPMSILVNAIFVFNKSSESSFQMSKIRIGGTIIGSCYAVLVLKLIVIEGNPYTITVFNSLFSTFMAFFAPEYPGIASVASFVAINVFYTRPSNIADYDVFALNVIVQTFIGAIIVVIFYLWQFYTSSNRRIMRQNTLDILKKFSLTIGQCLDVFDNFGKDMENEKKNKYYRGIDTSMAWVKGKVKEQRNLIFAILEEPSLNKVPINVFLAQKLYEYMEQLADIMYWMGIATHEISIANKDDVDICFGPIKENVSLLKKELETLIDLSSNIIGTFHNIRNVTKEDEKEIVDIVNITKIYNKIDLTSHKIIKSILIKKKGVLMDASYFTSFLSYVFILGKITNHICKIYEVVIDLKVTYFQEASHF